MWFASNEVLFQTILVYALLAFSIQISLRAGVFSLAGVGCWAIGGYVVAILSLRGWNIVLALVIALVAAGIVTMLLSLLLVRLRGLYLGMATVAFNLMVGVAVLNGGSLTGGATGLYGIPATVGLGVLALIAAVVALLLTALETRALGRAYEVVREDEQLANSLGVNTQHARHFVFVLSGIVGALAGGLHALVLGTVSSEDSGFSVIVVALTMVIIGGFQSWRGALIGAALIQWLPVGLQSMGFAAVSDWWTAIYGALIVVIAVYAPRGILGLLQDGTRRLGAMLAPRDRRPAPEFDGDKPAPRLEPAGREQ
jgi:branched-chain amino acid transport system permease protein